MSHTPRKASSSPRRSGRLVLMLILAGFIGMILPALPAVAADTGVIASAGPLSSITTSSDLNCDVRYAADSSPEFYGGTACGTLVAVGGTLYGPGNIPAGGSASPRTAYTPVSQTGPTGSGTVADPYKVITTVDLGGSGLRLTQTDTYVTGQENYRTDVSIVNSSGSSATAQVYRAADCYLANSDFGLGQATDNSIACLSTSNRVEQWIPITSGSHYYQAGYNEVWSRIGTQQPFPDTCRCSENIDNGAGLSWQITISAGATGRVSQLTAFSPTRTQSDRDGDGLLDDWEINGLDVNGDGTPDVDLPAMGASPDHKDIFVEADWMFRERNCILWIFCTNARSFAPNLDALNDVTAAMAAAPVSNPDGTTGIRIHIDAGPNSIMNPVTRAKWGSRSQANSVGYVASLGSFSGTAYNWTDYNNLKSSNFNPVRRDIFHYALYADQFAGSRSSGIAQVTGARFAGDSFMLTDGDSSWSSGFTRRQEAGTFMHELGHTLGLRHGGGDDENNKPNYLSIMNYLYQLGEGNRPVDYSRSALGVLDETSLSEQDGILGATGPYSWFCSDNSRRNQSGAGSSDWNCNGAVQSGRISANITGDAHASGNPALNQLSSFNDWSHLIYDGGAVGAFGADDLEDQDPPPTLTSADEPTADDFKAASSYGQDGDGSIRAVGPTALFASVDNQKIQVDVTNVGSTDADYTIHSTGLEGVAAATAVAVPASTTKRVELPVDGSQLRVGTSTLTLTLSGANSDDILASDTLAVTVPDLTDPATRAEADDTLTQLPSIDGLDPAVRSGLIHATSAALGVGQLDRISIVPESPTTSAGQAVQFTVTAIDAHGGTIGDVTDQAQLSATSPATCQGNACSATKTGTYTISANYQGKTATGQLTVTPGAPAALGVTAGDMQSAVSGQVFPNRLAVKMVDSYDNPVPNTDVTFAVTSGSASFAGSASTVVRTNADGLATAPSLTAGSEAGPVVVTATAGAASVGFLESVTSAGTGKADLRLTLTTPLTARAGQEITLTAKVVNTGTAAATGVRTVIALPRGYTITDAGGGTVKGSLVVQAPTSVAPSQQTTLKIKAKVPTNAKRWTWVGALTGSSTKESNYRNNGAVTLIAIR